MRSWTCWIISETPLRTDEVPDTITDIFLTLPKCLSADKWTSFANTLWAVWRCRNDLVYQKQQPSHDQFLRKYSQIKSETILVQVVKGSLGEQVVTDRGAASGLVCYLDACWVSSWATGLTYILKLGIN